MNLQEKLQRSRSTEKIDFSKIGSFDIQDLLVKVETSDRILVEPNWTLENSWEGKRYADYITDHPEYDGVYVRSDLLSRLLNAEAELPEVCGDLPIYKIDEEQYVQIDT